MPSLRTFGGTARVPPYTVYVLVFLCPDIYFTGAIKCWYGVSGNIT